MVYRRFSLLAKAGFLAVLAGSAAAGPARAERLAEAMVAALNHHPGVEAAIANRDAYAEERREQWSGYLPQLSMGAGAGRGYLDNSTSRGLTVTRGAAYSWLWEDTLTLRQPLFDGFETLNKVRAADARRDSAGYNIADVRENLALQTVVAYLDVMRTRAVVEDIKEHRGKIDGYIGRIKKMVNEGAADKSMISQAEDIKAQLENTLADMEGLARSSVAAYVEIVGREPDGEMEMPKSVVDVLPPASNAAAQIGSHPALKAAQMTERALAREAEADDLFYLPTVSGELSHVGRDQKDEVGGESVDDRAMLRVNWDFSLGGGQMAKARKSAYRHAEGRAQGEQARRRIERQVAGAYSDFETAGRQLAILQDRRKINEDLFGNAKAQFEGARINLLQLLQADNALFNAGLSLMNGEYRYMASQYAVLASFGKLQTTMNIKPVPSAPAGGAR